LTDSKIEVMIAALLRTGVLVAGAVVLAGGCYYLAAHGTETADYHKFGGQPEADRLVQRIVAGAIALRPRSVIQLGVLLLIATPILRVAVSLVGFAMERDRQYVTIAAIVLALLVYSLVSGTAGG
jgi:uncharacterized membrane protein